MTQRRDIRHSVLWEDFSKVCTSTVTWRCGLFVNLSSRRVGVVNVSMKVEDPRLLWVTVNKKIKNKRVSENRLDHLQDVVRETSTVFVNNPTFSCYILYIGQWGFHYIKFQKSWKVPSTSTTWTDMCVVQVSTTRRPLLHTEDGEGTASPRSTTDSTDQWVWCLIHIWSLLHVISVICLSWGPPQETLVVFGYMEVHTNTIHLIYIGVYLHKYIGHEDNVQTGGVVRVRLYVI